MEALVLYDLDGSELYFNPDHVVYVHKPGMFSSPGARAVIHLASGYDIPVLDTPGQVLFKLQKLQQV